MIRGIFISDVHMPDNINLNPIFAFIKDYQPNLIILGGDIIDAKGLHGVDSMSTSQIDVSLYQRDIKLLRGLFREISKVSPNSQYVYLEGNHEERYQRIMAKYPKTFPDNFDIYRDAFDKNDKVSWVPYGDYSSYVTVGDTLFIHGNIWPDLHAKAYAIRYTPHKVVYGHLHHFQAYTTHRANPNTSPRYAVTAGCLCKLDPDWKKGEAHKWVNGFVSFISENGITIPTAHLIENGMFAIGRKIYK